MNAIENYVNTQRKAGKTVSYPADAHFKLSGLVSEKYRNIYNSGYPMPGDGGGDRFERLRNYYETKRLIQTYQKGFELSSVINRSKQSAEKLLTVKTLSAKKRAILQQIAKRGFVKNKAGNFVTACLTTGYVNKKLTRKDFRLVEQRRINGFSQLYTVA